MNVKTIQERIIKNRVDETIECLNLAVELLEASEATGGKMNGLSTALASRAKDIEVQIEHLQRHIKEHLTPAMNLPGFKQTVNQDLIDKLSDGEVK